MPRKTIKEVGFDKLADFYLKEKTKPGVFLVVYHPNSGCEVPTLNEMLGVTFKEEDETQLALLHYTDTRYDCRNLALEDAKAVHEKLASWIYCEVWIDGKRVWKPKVVSE